MAKGKTWLPTLHDAVEDLEKFLEPHDFAQVEEEGQQIREKIEASQPDMRDLRERLLKRLEEKRRQSRP